MLLISRTRLFSLALSFVLVWFVVAQESNNNNYYKKKKILAFGGNGFIGTETLSRLIAADDDFDITLVSRGSWNFDSDLVIKPHVRHVVCDREQGIQNCKDLMADIKATEQYYAVIDFSAEEPDWVRDVVKVLDKKKVRVYIYLSTAAVYEVSTVEKSSKLGRKILETDAVRPDDEELREELNVKDWFGDDKLAGEEVLMVQRTATKNVFARLADVIANRFSKQRRKQQELNDKEECDDKEEEGEKVLVQQRDERKTGFPYVSLRLADVFGPRDGSDLFVAYFMWIKYQHIQRVPKIHVRKDMFMFELTSITYVKDAATSIIAAIDKPESWDEAYNIACEENFNTTSFLGTMGTLMGKGEDMEIQNWKPMIAVQVYPTTTRGPLDISKAREKLGFAPTPMELALKETIAWYENVFASDKETREKFVQEWLDTVFDNYNEQEEYTKEVTEAVLSDFHDEL